MSPIRKTPARWVDDASALGLARVPAASQKLPCSINFRAWLITWPDLKAELLGHCHYFELGEIVQQDWLKALAQREKKPIIDSPLPLTAVWSPLESIIRKKVRKKYAPQATPLSLLLLFGAERSPLVRD